MREKKTTSDESLAEPGALSGPATEKAVSVAFPPEPATPAPEATPTPSAAEVAKVYVVAPGTAITSKRGQLNAGATVLPRDLSGGEATFAELVKAGTLVATEPKKTT